MEALVLSGITSKQVTRGSNIRESQEEDDQARMVCLMVIDDLVANFDDNEEDILDPRLLIDSIFETLQLATEDLFEQCALTLTKINSTPHVNGEEGENLVVEKCLEPGSTFSGNLAESLMGLLNGNAYPNCEEEVTTATLKLWKCLFQDPTSSACVYLNDINVLIEVCVRELVNTPEDEGVEVRPFYVDVLHLIMLNTEWGLKGSYKKGEICRVMNSFMGMGEGVVGKECVAAVEDLMLDVGEMLKDN